MAYKRQMSGDSCGSHPSLGRTPATVIVLAEMLARASRLGGLIMRRTTLDSASRELGHTGLLEYYHYRRPRTPDTLG